MPGTLSVWLNTTRVGILTNLPGDYTVFAFDDAYREHPGRPILSQSLVNATGEPLRAIPRTHTVSPAFFSNLLPEPDTLLRALLARQHGIKLIPDFGFLRALGDDLPGAVRLLEEGSVPEPFGADDERDFRPGTPLRFSVAGVQLKFSARMRGDRLTIPSKGGTQIIKLPTNAYPRLPENEYAMMGFATAIGLTVPKIDLIPMSHVDNFPEGLPALRADEPQLVYVIERFDRLSGGVRVHVEDLNQVAGQFSADKYENKTTSYVAKVVNELCPAGEVEELIARIVFGVAIGNNDMHLKNWALIYQDGTNARLAPLYDYVCTRRYFPDGKLALTIGGENRFDRITEDAFGRFADAAGLSSKMTWRVARETASRIRAGWPSYRESIADPTLADALDDHMKALPLLR